MVIPGAAKRSIMREVTMVTPLPRLSVLFLAAVLGSSCAESSRTDQPAAVDVVSAARAELIGALNRCKEMHGYDPAATAAIAENALAPGELAWRQCAYAALRAYRNPDPAVRQQIESLVVEDVAMTAAVQQGTMTRSQRKARNLEQIEAIKALEEAQARAAAEAQTEHDAQVRQVVDGLRGFAN